MIEVLEDTCAAIIITLMVVATMLTTTVPFAMLWLLTN
jgi:hypothetical protein